MAPFQTAQLSAPAPAPLVDLQDVVVNLASAAGTVNVLRGLNLTADPGERLGVVGPSGSGKTTMLMVMAGLERGSSGRIVMAGG
ncbi:MAG TPA: ATP-binding cassette domain-containing protein, partial [Azospirillaceae bacterium]|nr:ATP-binding cassette domain-containing protein [Azospirillaceae bacterium]